MNKFGKLKMSLRAWRYFDGGGGKMKATKCSRVFLAKKNKKML